MRWFRGSVDVQTEQSQPIMGTPRGRPRPQKDQPARRCRLWFGQSTRPQSARNRSRRSSRTVDSEVASRSCRTGPDFTKIGPRGRPLLDTVSHPQAAPRQRISRLARHTFGEIDLRVDFTQRHLAADRGQPQRVLEAVEFGQDPVIALAGVTLHPNLVLGHKHILP